MTVSVFGTHAGETLHRVELASEAGLRAAVIGYGATLQDLIVPMPDGPRRLTLGFPTLADYVAHRAYFGAVVGRFGNRIGNGRFSLEGRTIQLDCNERGRQHLHGGGAGFGTRVWRLVDSSAFHAMFEIVSPDGDMGYPGRVVVRATYRVEGLALAIAFEAETDAATIINIVAHPYFNLAGSGDILGHRLKVASEAVVETDADLIPTGRLLPVAGTGHDFRAARMIDETGIRHDICHVLTGSGPAAELTSPDGLLTMAVETRQPGLQVYDGEHIAEPMPGHGRTVYPRHGGLCLEAQGFPDSPNHPGFPDRTLRPGEIYRSGVTYRFRL